MSAPTRLAATPAATKPGPATKPGAQSRPRPGNWTRWLAQATIAVLTLGVFGPYVQIPVPGVRTEQLIGYGLVPVGVILWLTGRVRTSRHVALVVFLFAIQAAVAIVAPVANNTQYGTGRSYLAGLDNLLLPIAVLTVVSAVAGLGVETERLIRLAGNLLVAGMSVNALLAFGSMTYDLRPILAHFWTGDAQAVSVADLAAHMGRFSGIINHPAEAGVLYSIALLAAVQLYRDRIWLFALTSGLLVFGGLLAVSKIFMLGGLPVAMWQAVRISENRARRLTTIGGLGLVALAVAQTTAVASWRGAGAIALLVSPTGRSDLINLYTAGRFGQTSTLRDVSMTVLQSSPWFGYGVSGLGDAYDNGWVEALVISGLIGVAVYTAVLGVLVVAWWQRRQQVPRWWSSFGGGLAGIAIGGSLGIPALTGNRMATIAWILLTLLLLGPVTAREPDLPAGCDHGRPRE